MKSRILSLMVALCMILSCMAVNVFAEDTSVTLLTGIFDGNIPSSSSVGFYYLNGGTYTSETLGLGGKAADDAYAKIDSNSFSAGDSRMLINNGAGCFNDTYYVISLNVYGNNTYVGGYNRRSDGNKVYFNSNASRFKANQWNNYKLVYSTATYKASVYINGVKVDDDKASGDIDFSAHSAAQLNQIRLNLAPNVGNIYIDDLAAYTANAVPADYMPSITSTDVTLFEDTGNIMFTGDSAVLTTDGTMRVSKDDGATWTVSNTVEDGDIVVIEKESDYGKAYKYCTAFTSTGFKNTLGTQDSGISFVQGGLPQDSEGNVYKTDSTALITEIENIYGSGLTMKRIGSGVNLDTSVQSYYEYSWPNAGSATAPRYLVLEADVAFPGSSGNIIRAYKFGLSTNKGTVIGTEILPDFEYLNRINHYMWIYDTEAGTYNEYINGKPLHDEPQAILAAFASGERKAMRFGVSGEYKENATDPTMLYCGYIANLEIYEAYESEVRQPLYIPGSKISTLPVTKGSVTLGEILAMFDEADRENVTVYANRSYGAVTDENASISSGSGIIVTEKDGMYDYARICWAPSENADYAIETLQKPADGSVYTVILNYGEKRQLTPILVRYNTDGTIADIEYKTETRDTQGTVGIGLPATENTGKVELFVWDGLSNLKPIDEAITIK